MTDSSIKKILYIIFVLALITKFICFLFLNTCNGPEVFEYENITNNILDGKGFVFNFYGKEQKAFIQPFYPVFTAVVYYMTNHSKVAMVVMQSIISSLLCFIIYSIAIRLTDVKEALAAAVITAFHPGLTVYSVLKLHPLVFDVFFYLLTVSLILRFAQKPNAINAILTGFAVGLALLSRSTILVFVIFALLYMFFILREVKIKIRLRYLFIICGVAILVYSPWVIRNYKVFNQFVFMQTCSGENLWMGNNEMASGSAVLPSGKSIHEVIPEQMRKEIENLDELGQLGYFNNYFLNFVKDKPLLFIKLFAKKFYYFWWFAPHTGIFYKNSWLRGYKLYYAILFFLFIVGLIFSVKKRAHIHVIVMLSTYMLLLALLHAVVNVDTRHRWIIEPIMIIFASIGFFNIAGYLKNRLTHAWK